MDSNYVQVSDDELIAALDRPPRFTRVQDGAHLAYLLDVDEDEKAPAREENLTLSVEEAQELPEADTYEVGQRIIIVALPYLGATVRSVHSYGIGVDYDNDGDARGAYDALFSRIRPMPYL